MPHFAMAIDQISSKIIFQQRKWTIWTQLCWYQFHPKPSPPGTRLEEWKNPPPGTTIVYKNPPLGTEQGVKSPTAAPGHKVRKFHKYIYKLWYYLKWKAFVVSANKTVFQWGDWLLKYISFGGHQSQTIERIKALYDMYKCMLIIF